MSYNLFSVPMMSLQHYLIIWKFRSDRIVCAPLWQLQLLQKPAHHSQCSQRWWTSTESQSSTCRTESSNPCPSCLSTSVRWARITSTLSPPCWRMLLWTGTKREGRGQRGKGEGREGEGKGYKIRKVGQTCHLTHERPSANCSSDVYILLIHVEQWSKEEWISLCLCLGLVVSVEYWHILSMKFIKSLFCIKCV